MAVGSETEDRLNQTAENAKGRCSLLILITTEVGGVMTQWTRHPEHRWRDLDVVSDLERGVELQQIVGIVGGIPAGKLRGEIGHAETDTQIVSDIKHVIPLKTNEPGLAGHRGVLEESRTSDGAAGVTQGTEGIQPVSWGTQ